MRYNDRTIGYMIARESSRDTSTKLIYCTEAIVALMMQARLVSTATPLPQDVITLVIIDEAHRRSAHSDYVFALTLAVMQKTPDLRPSHERNQRSQASSGKDSSLSTTCDEGSHA